MKQTAIFSKTRELEGQIDEFFDKVGDGALSFKLGIGYYLDGDTAAFEDKLKQVNEIESRGDTLRRQIERKLYVQTLIPESRGDVLGLLENLDGVHGLLEGGIASRLLIELA